MTVSTAPADVAPNRGITGFRRIDPFPVNNSRARDATYAIAVLAVAMLGFDRRILIDGVTTGTIVVIALAPVWLGTLREFRFARQLLALALVAVAFGALLTALQSDRGFSLTWAINSAGLFLTSMGGIGLLLWVRTFLPLYVIGAVFGGAVLLGNLQGVPGSVNPWKHEIAIPLAIAALAWADRKPGIRLSVFGLVVLALVSAAADFRSMFGFCMLAVVVLVWQNRTRSGERKPSKLATVALLGVALVALYSAASSLLLGGYLGEETQTRTLEQVENGGNLLVGGRVEWAATLALAEVSPGGFGLGTTLNGADIAAANAGMVAVGSTPNDTFRENYMFGGHIKLHSIGADMWVAFGIMGLALAVTLAGLLVYNLLDALGNRAATGLLSLMTIISVWSLAFEPTFSNLAYVMFTVAIGLPVVTSARLRHAVRATEMMPGQQAAVSSETLQ